MPSYGGGYGSNYGSGGYGSSSYYASSSTNNAVYVKPDDTCSPAPETCSTCENYVNLDVIGKACSFDRIFYATINAPVTSTPVNGTSVSSCGKMTVNQMIAGEKLLSNMSFSLNEKCTCAELNEVDTEVIVFVSEPLASPTSLAMSDKYHVVRKTDSTKSDTEDLLKRCQEASE
jgi:hypothetical protein